MFNRLFYRVSLLEARYDLENYECELVRHFCFAFGIGDDPQPEHGVGFKLMGINHGVIVCVDAQACLREYGFFKWYSRGRHWSVMLVVQIYEKGSCFFIYAENVSFKEKVELW